MFPILKIDSESPCEFVKFWSTQYKYANGDLYNDNISMKPFNSGNIYKLYEWKNGRKLSGKKEQFPKRIISKLDLINELVINWDIKAFDKAFGKERTIWKIFLMHIIQTAIYPIFDMHVYRAYTYINSIKGFELEKYSEQEKYKIYLNEYIPFYDKLKAESGYSHKKVDEAMWAFGKFLSAYPEIIDTNI